MEQKLWFSFLLMHVIRVRSSPNQWLISVPTRVPAVEGSCVVIPCSYTFPRSPLMQTMTRRTGFWKNGNQVVATTRPKWRLPEEYKRRTKFLGDLQAQNCTVQLSGVRSADVGPFYFRVEMTRLKSFSYRNDPVHIDVISEPAPPALSVQVSVKVSAFCFVYHSCPTSPPEFSWSQSGRAIQRTKKLNAWQWKTGSTLTFPPRPTALNQTLNCTVRYSGGRQATGSVVLPI